MFVSLPALMSPSTDLPVLTMVSLMVLTLTLTDNWCTWLSLQESTFQLRSWNKLDLPDPSTFRDRTSY